MGTTVSIKSLHVLTHLGFQKLLMIVVIQTVSKNSNTCVLQEKEKKEQVAKT